MEFYITGMLHLMFIGKALGSSPGNSVLDYKTGIIKESYTLKDRKPENRKMLQYCCDLRKVQGGENGSKINILAVDDENQIIHLERPIEDEDKNVRARIKKICSDCYMQLKCMMAFKNYAHDMLMFTMDSGEEYALPIITNTISRKIWSSDPSSLYSRWLPIWLQGAISGIFPQDGMVFTISDSNGICVPIFNNTKHSWELFPVTKDSSVLDKLRASINARMSASAYPMDFSSVLKVSDPMERCFVNLDFKFGLFRATNLVKQNPEVDGAYMPFCDYVRKYKNAKEMRYNEKTGKLEDAAAKPNNDAIPNAQPGAPNPMDPSRSIVASNNKPPVMVDFGTQTDETGDRKSSRKARNATSGNAMTDNTTADNTTAGIASDANATSGAAAASTDAVANDNAVDNNNNNKPTTPVTPKKNKTSKLRIFFIVAAVILLAAIAAFLAVRILSDNKADNYSSSRAAIRV